MDLKWILVMVVGAAMGLIGKKHQNAGWGQAIAIVGVILMLGGAICSFVSFSKSSDKPIRVENRFRFIQGKFLAEAMKEACSPQKVCVIVDPTIMLDPWGDPRTEIRELGFFEGVKSVLNNCEVIPVYPEYTHKKGGEPPMSPYPYLTAKDYKKVVDQIKKEKPDCVINTYAFPRDATLPKAMADLKGFKVGMLNTDYIYGKSDAEITAVFKDGGRQCAELIAVVQQRAGDFFSEDSPASEQKAFDYRYVMLTKDNVEQGLKEAAAGKK